MYCTTALVWLDKATSESSYVLRLALIYNPVTATTSDCGYDTTTIDFRYDTTTSDCGYNTTQ